MSGESCGLSCDDGYVMRGLHPHCLAGVVTHSLRCIPGHGGDDVAATTGAPAAPTDMAPEPSRDSRPVPRHPTAGHKPSQVQEPASPEAVESVVDTADMDSAAVNVQQGTQQAVAAPSETKTASEGVESKTVTVLVVTVASAFVVMLLVMLVAVATKARGGDAPLATFLKRLWCRRTPAVGPSLPPTVSRESTACSALLLSLNRSLFAPFLPET